MGVFTYVCLLFLIFSHFSTPLSIFPFSLRFPTPCLIFSKSGGLGPPKTSKLRYGWTFNSAGYLFSGPFNLPIVGYLPFMGPTPHLKFLEMSKKYGDIFQLQVGLRRVVVVNSLKTIKQVKMSKTGFSNFHSLLRIFFKVGSSVDLANRPVSLVMKIIQNAGQNAFAFRPYTAQVQFLRKCAVKALGKHSLYFRWWQKLPEITPISGYFTTSQSSRLQELTVRALDECESDLSKASNLKKDPKSAYHLESVKFRNSLTFQTWNNDSHFFRDWNFEFRWTIWQTVRSGNSIYRSNSRFQLCVWWAVLKL